MSHRGPLFMSEYDQQLAEWKSRHGINPDHAVNQDELLMAVEESAAKGKHWCFGCDVRFPIRDMKLITRSIDPYLQCDEGETDYIAKYHACAMMEDVE